VHYRRIAKTTLNLSEIGFGCGGNAGLMVRGNHTEQQRVVARAVELGINYFDTAPDYVTAPPKPTLAESCATLDKGLSSIRRLKSGKIISTTLPATSSAHAKPV